MAVLTLDRRYTGQAARRVFGPGTEFFPPADTFHNLPDPAALPRDEIGRELALLLHEHPHLAEVIGPVPPSLSDWEKRELLSQAKTALGIRPFRRPNLGYVGR